MGAYQDRVVWRAHGADSSLAPLSRSLYLSDPVTMRNMARQHERRAFGAQLRRLRLEWGLSLRGMAKARKDAAKRLRFGSHSPLPYQLVAYESGRSGAHRRTRLVIAAATGVGVTELVSAST